MKIGNYGDIKSTVTNKIQTSTQRSELISKNNFNDFFQNAVKNSQDIKFSKHAQTRMQERKIELSQFELEKIKEAVSKAGSKGIKDSLVLLESVALIINVPSKTVVTTVEKGSIKENIFTNIDGAVIL